MNITGLEKIIKEDNRRVICFGTGLMAVEALKSDIVRTATVFFIDNDCEKDGKQVIIGDYEYVTYSPLNAFSLLNEGDIILLTSGHYKSMRTQLAELGIANIPGVEIYDYPVLRVSYSPDSEEFFEERFVKESLKEYDIVLEQMKLSPEENAVKRSEMEKYIRGNSKKERPLVIPRVMVMPTTRCNLRCKGCSSLLPYFDKPSDCDINQILHDFKVFFSGIDKCIRITIGGEPFFYPQLARILEYLIAEDKVLGIMLITNSMMLPKDEVLPLLANEKVLVEVSDYGQLEKMGRLITLLEGASVRFKVLTEQTWTDMGGIECRGRDKEEIRFNYMNCDQSRVIKGMHNGRFYTCARSARMAALGAYDASNDSFELLDTDSPEDVREKLLRMYYSDYADSCNYCDLGALPTKVIPAGIQMSANMKKSAYTIVNREELERLRFLAMVKEQA